MNYELKIQDIYIDNIKRGYKRYEYRLNDSKFANLKAGDTLTLISSYNNVNNAFVRVKRFIKYPNWREALIDDWMHDFKDIYKSLDETINACSKFYADDLVNKHGIIKIEIEIANSLVDYKVLGINICSFKNINISEEFFNSLREDYPKFNDWFNKKATNNEYAYIYKKDNKLAGFLYLKKEFEEDNNIKPTFEKKLRLKVGTLKIDSNIASGFRLGERFLKIIFDNALKMKAEEIYITLFENRRDGVNALRDKYLLPWGFKKHGTKMSNNESVFVKEMNVYDRDKNIQFNYPSYKNDFNMYFLPIASEYHTKLFPDMIIKTEEKERYNIECGSLYSLNKIYVSGISYLKSSKVIPGDIIVIYRMGEPNTYKNYSSVCTGLGIVESIHYPKTLNEYIGLCSNKSVFSKKELINFYNNKKYKTIIKLIPLKTYNKKIILKTLRDMGICDSDSGPRTFDKISQEFISKFLYND